MKNQKDNRKMQVRDTRVKPVHENSLGAPYWYHLISIVVISLFCIVCYCNIMQAPFVFDDFSNIRNNPFVRVTSLGFGQLYDAAFESVLPRRPIANISFALNYYLGKYDPLGYHIVNLAVHLVNGVLVYFLALIIFRQVSCIGLKGPTQATHSSMPQSPNPSITLMSVFASLIFVAHPLQIQSVTYIVQRMNSMAAMFYFMSLLLYIQGRLARLRWKQLTFLGGAFLAWLLALGSKEIAATLPFVILLYEWCFLRGLSIAWVKKNLWYLLIPLTFVALFAPLALGPQPFESVLAGYVDRDFTLYQRVLTQFRVVIFYVTLLLYPHPSRLNLLHPFMTSHSLLDPITTLISLLLIASLIGTAIFVARRQRLVSFCILWFFLNLVIESSVIGLEMVFEHRLYLPMFGFALMVSHLLFYSLSKKRLWYAIIFSGICISLAMATSMRNEIWQDDEALWSDVLSKHPRSHRAHDNLGIALSQQGRVKEAMGHFLEAMRIKSDDPKTYNNMGTALLDQGRLDEAVGRFSEALEINPAYAEAHYNLGRALSRQGRLNDAISHFSTALKLDPREVDTYNELGNALVKLGYYDDAADLYLEAIRIEPSDVKAHGNLGVVMMGQGRLDEAVSHFSKALQIESDEAQIHSNLGVALVRQERLEEAVRHFSEALRLNPNDENARYNLDFVQKLMSKGTDPSGPVESP